MVVKEHPGWGEYPEHGGDLRWAAEFFGRPPGDFLDFSSSLNPLGPPSEVKEFLRELGPDAPAFRSLTTYPDPEAREARRALAGFLGVPEEAVLLTNGGTEAIRLAVLLWREVSAERGWVPSLFTWAPAFGEYEQAARALRMPVGRVFLRLEGTEAVREPGGRPEKVPKVTGPGEAEAIPSPSALLPLGRPGALFFLCCPHSPTGAWVEEGEVLALCDSLPPGAGVVVDEAFLWLAEKAWAGRRFFRSLAWKAVKRENLWVVGSLTKAFALPGVRVGYVVARPEIIGRMQKLQPAWSVNGLAQVLIPPCIQAVKRGYLERTLALLKREKGRFYGDRELGYYFHFFPSEANFLLGRELSSKPVPASASGLRVPLFVLLGRRGILVRDLSSTPGLGPGYFRVAVRTEEENRRLIEALREVSRLS